MACGISVVHRNNFIIQINKNKTMPWAGTPLNVTFGYKVHILGENYT